MDNITIDTRPTYALRTTYVLSHNGEFLLELDASITPSFALGEEVELYDDESHQSTGWYVVERIGRTIPYRTIVNVGMVELAMQTITVHLRRKDVAQEDAPHVA